MKQIQGEKYYKVFLSPNTLSLHFTVLLVILSTVDFKSIYNLHFRLTYPWKASVHHQPVVLPNSSNGVHLTNQWKPSVYHQPTVSPTPSNWVCLTYQWKPSGYVLMLSTLPFSYNPNHLNVSWTMNRRVMVGLVTRPHPRGRGLVTSGWFLGFH